MKALFFNLRLIAIFIIILLASGEGEVNNSANIPDGTVDGYVYDTDTSAPLSGAFVYCQDANCPKAASAP